MFVSKHIAVSGNTMGFDEHQQTEGLSFPPSYPKQGYNLNAVEAEKYCIK